MESLSQHFSVFHTNPSAPQAFGPKLYPFLLYWSSAGPFGFASICSRVCIKLWCNLLVVHVSILVFNSLIPCSKWKADKHGVRCIRLGPKGNTLLSAGRSIKLWDLKTKETLRVRNTVQLKRNLPRSRETKFSSGETRLSISNNYISLVLPLGLSKTNCCTVNPRVFTMA